jgi:hypothetical protein
MPGVFKVGHTTRGVPERVKELSGATGVPTPFCVEGYYEVYQPKRVEEAAHQLLRPYRIRGNREFFRANRDVIGAAIEKAIASAGDQLGPRSKPLLTEAERKSMWRRHHQWVEQADLVWQQYRAPEIVHWAVIAERYQQKDASVGLSDKVQHLRENEERERRLQKTQERRDLDQRRRIYEHWLKRHRWVQQKTPIWKQYRTPELERFAGVVGKFIDIPARPDCAAVDLGDKARHILKQQRKRERNLHEEERERKRLRAQEEREHKARAETERREQHKNALRGLVNFLTSVVAVILAIPAVLIISLAAKDGGPTFALAVAVLGVVWVVLVGIARVIIWLSVFFLFG